MMDDGYTPAFNIFNIHGVS